MKPVLVVPVTHLRPGTETVLGKNLNQRLADATGDLMVGLHGACKDGEIPPGKLEPERAQQVGQRGPDVDLAREVVGDRVDALIRRKEGFTALRIACKIERVSDL
ncbi:MAG: hypothetical protein Q7T73_17095 [Beijerinckiaceae bacterium]|nr:hypothetical protein [Beijerinckiaceae bacterium]